MIKIMKGFNKFETPQGIAIMGTYPDLDLNSSKEKLEEMNNNLKDLKFIVYKNQTGGFEKLEVKGLEIASTLVGGFNIGILLGDINLPEGIKEDTPIYKA